MTADSFVAVDWGTTNRRAYLIEDGAVTRTERDALGILAVPAGGFPAAAAELRARFDGRPMLLAGMVGSNRGWADAGYVPCPATLEALAAKVTRVADGVAIVPGVCTIDTSHSVRAEPVEARAARAGVPDKLRTTGVEHAGRRGDVMRGEEVQLLGAAAGGLVPGDALLCQPGTHNKWARIERGILTGFATAMTGELFALLKSHALIGAAMTGAVTDGAAFRDGVARAAEGDLLTALFGVRPASILGLRADADAAGYVSGLLIGSDVNSHVAAGDEVYLLSDPALGTLYRVAIEAAGGSARFVDSHDAFVAGITRLWELVS